MAFLAERSYAMRQYRTALFGNLVSVGLCIPAGGVGNNGPGSVRLDMLSSFLKSPGQHKRGEAVDPWQIQKSCDFADIGEDIVLQGVEQEGLKIWLVDLPLAPVQLRKFSTPHGQRSDEAR